jgi:hypothetical protein
MYIEFHDYLGPCIMEALPRAALVICITRPFSVRQRFLLAAAWTVMQERLKEFLAKCSLTRREILLFWQVDAFKNRLPMICN